MGMNPDATGYNGCFRVDCKTEEQVRVFVLPARVGCTYAGYGHSAWNSETQEDMTITMRLLVHTRTHAYPCRDTLVAQQFTRLLSGVLIYFDVYVFFK